jgi:hypothetical protein
VVELVQYRRHEHGWLLCGAIRDEASGPMTGVTYCHCSKCRRWHGHVGAYTAVDRDAFRLTETRGLEWHVVSPTVKRGFCGECGSCVLFDEAPETKMGICAGTLDVPTNVHEKAHIYVASKGDYHAISGELPRYDTMP